MKPVLLVLALACLVACSGRDASPPAGQAAATAPPAAGSDSVDPAEAGIPDLARLARYVFRAMQDNEAACPIENPFEDKLHFAFAIDVAGGHMTHVGLAEVALEGPLGRLGLLERQWPPELVAYVKCLAPHLEATPMRPAPADGHYQPLYSFAGQPGGRGLP